MHPARRSTLAQGLVLVDSQVPFFHQLDWYCGTSVALTPPFSNPTARTLIALLYMQCPSARRSTARSSRPFVYYGFLDGRRIKSARNHRARCVLLLPRRHHLHLRHLCVITQLPKTYQSSCVLCIMGEHSLQYRYFDVGVTHSRRSKLTSVSISRLPHPDVNLCLGCLEVN